MKNLLSYNYISEVEDLPVSQNRVVDNEADEIYSEEIEMLEDQNDITYSPGILEDSERSSQAWSEQSSQPYNVRQIFL